MHIATPVSVSDWDFSVSNNNTLCIHDPSLALNEIIGKLEPPAVQLSLNL